jgi:hypothetical protein
VCWKKDEKKTRTSRIEGEDICMSATAPNSLARVVTDRANEALSMQQNERFGNEIQAGNFGTCRTVKLRVWVPETIRRWA